MTTGFLRHTHHIAIRINNRRNALLRSALFREKGVKMSRTQIASVEAYEILDSRSHPTVGCRVTLADGSTGEAAVPSGASTGTYEAFEKRDGDPARYGGKGVLGAVASVENTIAPALCGMSAEKQFEIDRMMIRLDKSANKSQLGANAILAVSLACARAAAASYGLPLYRYLGGTAAVSLPVPMMNILNGGAHAFNNIDIQEFMILPLGAENEQEAVRIGSEVYAALRSLLHGRGYSVAVGDEGGFAPDLSSDEEALELICEAIAKAGYHTDKVALALDVAATEWQSAPGVYRLPKRGISMSSEEIIDHFSGLVKKYPIVSIEDPLGEEDFEGWQKLTSALGHEVMLVGDDLFVTNERRLEKGIAEHCANAILIKPNQIGTLSETLSVISLAGENRYTHILSHRSGETEDTTIADIAVATGAAFIKTGAPCRSERTAKYNRLLAIERELGGAACYGIRG